MAPDETAQALSSFAYHAKASSLRATDLLAIVATTLVALAVFNSIAARFGLLDAPDGGRKIHTRPTPLTGGVSLLSGVWIGALLTTETLGVDLRILAMLGIVVTIHAFDDHSSLSARQRLAVDAMIALTFTLVTGAAIRELGDARGLTIALGALAIPATVFAYLALTNAFNMLDGLDGLAISQFLISIAALTIWRAAHTPEQGLDALTVAIFVASLPILAANLSLLGVHMHCFLGDSGARFLGFFLTYALVVEGARGLSPVEGAFLVALPLFDMCAVVAERLRARAGPMRPDRRHLHHLLIDSTGSYALTIAVMGALSFCTLGALAALGAAGADDLASALVLLALASAYWRLRRRGVSALARLVASRRSLRETGPAE